MADALGDGERIWAIESAGGLGYLLSQQLIAAGEHVVDIPATLASRVRVLSSGCSADMGQLRRDVVAEGAWLNPRRVGSAAFGRSRRCSAGLDPFRFGR